MKHRDTAERYGPTVALALSTWVKLSRAHAVFSRKMLEHIRSFGLTPPQFGVLEALLHRGPMSLSTLCSTSLVTGGNMTVVVDNLERDGLVRRQRSEGDRRFYEVHLTARGRRLIERVFPVHAAYVGRVSSVLSERELARLGWLLRKLGTKVADPDGTNGRSVAGLLRQTQPSQ